MTKTKIRLGDIVRCKITGFKGTATGHINYLYGCEQFLVKPKCKRDGDAVKGEWIDEPQLEIVKAKKVPKSKPKHGGERNHP